MSESESVFRIISVECQGVLIKYWPASGIFLPRKRETKTLFLFICRRLSKYVCLSASYISLWYFVSLSLYILSRNPVFLFLCILPSLREISSSPFLLQDGSHQLVCSMCVVCVACYVICLCPVCALSCIHTCMSDGVESTGVTGSLMHGVGGGRGYSSGWPKS